MSDEINRNQLLDRHTFINEKTAIKAAFSKGTWFVIGREDGASAIEEPMPESIKAIGKIPEGYALGEFKLLVYISLSFYKMIAELDYALDPSPTVIAALAKINITTVESVLRACPVFFFYKFISLNMIFFSQLPNEALADLKETFNSADNVNIVPTDVVEEVSVG